MVHCKQNNVDIKSFLAALLLVTSQTGSASVESREARSAKQSPAPSATRSKSWEDKSAQSRSRLARKQKFHFIHVRLGSRASALLVFFGASHPHGSRASPRMDRTGVFAITSDARPLQYAWRMVLLPRRLLMRTIILAG